jgi:hypothetical protein
VLITQHLERMDEIEIKVAFLDELQDLLAQLLRESIGSSSSFVAVP